MDMDLPSKKRILPLEMPKILRDFVSLRRPRLVGSVLLALFGWAAPGYADACDPEAILRNNVATYDSSILTWISYVDSLSSGQNTSNSGGANVKFGRASFGLNDAQAVDSYFKQNTGLQISKKQRISILSSYLPQERVDAYIACLKENKSDLSVIIPPEATYDEAFQITVKWHPTYIVVPKDGKTTREMKMMSVNAKIVGDDGNIAEQLSHTMEQNDSASFIVRRDISKTMYLTAYINGRTEIVTLPPKPRHTIDTDVIGSEAKEIVRSDHRGLSPVEVPLCVKATKGILLPSMARVVTVKTGPFSRTGEKMNSGNNGNQVCATIYSVGSACRTSECDHSIQGQLFVTEAFIKEIPDASALPPAMTTVGGSRP